MAAALVTGAAHADGKFYARERVPPGVPYQRACIVHANGEQTMVLQSAFAIEASAKTSGARTASPTAASAPTDPPLGWVVPLPSVPILDTIHPSRSFSLFRALEMRTTPVVTRVSEWILLGTGVILLASLIGSATVLVIRGIRLSTSDAGARRPATIAVGSFAILVILMVFVPALGVAGSARGVEVLHESEVGVYDAKVIRASDGAELLAWLNEHELQFTESDRPTLDALISKGWCFVVALVRPDERAAMTRRNRDRLLDPLVMRFATPEPVYPLALTATAGSDTEILLYILGNQRWQDDGRLPLRCAHPLDESEATILLSQTPESTIPRVAGGWLCKLKGTLTPAQMKSDLVFAPSSDPAPFREHLVRW